MYTFSPYSFHENKSNVYNINLSSYESLPIPELFTDNIQYFQAVLKVKLNGIIPV